MGVYIPRLTRYKWFRFLVPVVVFGLLCYTTWAYSHKFCYTQIYRQLHHRSICIGLITTVVFLDVLLLLLWVQIVVLVGPGRQPVVQPFWLVDPKVGIAGEYQVMLPPSCYHCDPNGYPIWCTVCQSLKLERTHHSSELNYCVAKFDHYCLWLGTVIGKDNYLQFLQFVMYLVALLTLMIVSICSFIRRIINAHTNSGVPLNPNIIVVLVLAILFWSFTVGLLFSHIYYCTKDITSIELLAARRNKTSSTKMYFCYHNKQDGLRYVVELSGKECNELWREQNILKNLFSSLGTRNIALWFIPIALSHHRWRKELDPHGTDVQSVMGQYWDPISGKTIALLREKISKGEYIISFSAYGDTYQIGKEGTSSINNTMA